jgi:hypothetical protein
MFTKLIPALALCAAASGCFVVDDNTPAYGTLTAQWTLDGSTGADVCAYYAVDRADVVVFDQDGFDTADAQPVCEDFGVSFDLPAGWYSTEVTLLDFQGHAVSDTVAADVRVVGDNEVVVDVDFPDSTIF